MKKITEGTTTNADAAIISPQFRICLLYTSKNYTDDAIHLITYDGLHPNALGYEIMADTLKNTLYKNNIHI